MLNTNACDAVFTSAFVVALNTLTVAKHPCLMAEDSSGRWFVPHVCTSIAALLTAILVRTKEKLAFVGQLSVAGKLTFRLRPAGNMGPGFFSRA